jgi:hypothetical protein
MTIDDKHVDDLIAKREAAERVVEGMPEGPRKDKSFEVVLQHLLAGDTRRVAGRRRSRGRTAQATKARSQAAQRPRRASGPKGLVTELAEEGFFDTTKLLTDVQAELRRRGHSFKQTDLSPTLNRLTKAKILGREQAEGEGGRQIWAYRRFGA